MKAVAAGRIGRRPGGPRA